MLVGSLPGMLHSARIGLSCEHVSIVSYRDSGLAFVHCFRHLVMAVWSGTGNQWDCRFEAVAAVGLNLQSA